MGEVNAFKSWAGGLIDMLVEPVPTAPLSKAPAVVTANPFKPQASAFAPMTMSPAAPLAPLDVAVMARVLPGAAQVSDVVMVLAAEPPAFSVGLGGEKLTPAGPTRVTAPLVTG
jgi:hypothetical protein